MRPWAQRYYRYVPRIGTTPLRYVPDPTEAAPSGLEEYKRSTWTRMPSGIRGVPKFPFPYPNVRIYSKGRIAEHEIELLATELVVEKGVAQLDLLNLLPLDQHFRLAGRVTLGIESERVEQEVDSWLRAERFPSTM